jgi:hypothetical protein
MTASQTVVVSGVDPVIQVTNKALATNVATITTATAHGIAVGDTVVIANVDSTFNGTYTTTTGTTGTTINYAKTAANVTSAASTGTATRTLFNGSYTIASVPSTTTITYSVTHADVTSFSVAAGAVESTASISSSTTGYNVPGNINFNADQAIDRVLNSNENPTS